MEKCTSILQFRYYSTNSQGKDQPDCAAALAELCSSTELSSSGWVRVHNILRKIKILRKCAGFCCIQVSIKFLHPFPMILLNNFYKYCFILMTTCSMEVQCNFQYLKLKKVTTKFFSTPKCTLTKLQFAIYLLTSQYQRVLLLVKSNRGVLLQHLS